ncbi:MAG: hypothetical protein AAB733_02050 [Patescibacteria group bacterium]
MASSLFFHLSRQRDLREGHRTVSRQYFSRTAELLKGEQYLFAHTPELQQRADGCTILVHDDGMHEYEYGTFEENKEAVNRHYLGQHLPAHYKELKGQTGCPGSCEVESALS